MQTIHTSQILPVSIAEAWDFLSLPENLAHITPAYLGFNILNKEELRKIYQGQIIHYKVSPLFNIPLDWVTEVTHVDEPNYFVDEQRFGPYKFWHHKHFLKEHELGVIMEDLIHYSLPFGFIGNLMNGMIVKKQLGEIFQYRFKKLEEMFGTVDHHSKPIKQTTILNR